MYVFVLDMIFLSLSDRELEGIENWVGYPTCGLKAAGREKSALNVLTSPSMSRPIQTIHPTDLGLLPSWISMFGPPAQEFLPSWDHF